MRNSASLRDSTFGKFTSRCGRRKRHAAASYARRQFHRGVGAEGEPVAAGVKLRVECSVGTRPNASEARRSAVVRRHPGGALTREEDERH
jgi:hypothetical protein